MKWISTFFGVPLAPKKTEGPVTVITFLGIEIDSGLMECRLPEDKLVDLRQVVGRTRLTKKLRLQEWQSLLGKLQFVCRIIPMGRVFCRWLAMASAGMLVPSHFIWLSAEVRVDFSIWSVFLD